MRINRYIALATGMSRRAADKVVEERRVHINDILASPASTVTESDHVTLDGKPVRAPEALQTIILNKPVGYVVSRDGQGSRTVYELLPPAFQDLKPIGRLDKDSSGLLLLTNDGALAHQLTHPSFQKIKLYEVKLSKPLQPLHRQMINDIGVQLEDGRSQLGLERLKDGDDHGWRITMHEGRNRQIRRTFSALGYEVVHLHRTQFGAYTIPADTPPGSYKETA
jgi:23S rRNA pseudouridine2605 synthase